MGRALVSIDEIEIDGFSAAQPVENEDDWLDCVRWPVNVAWMERKNHDRDGYLCDIAGSPACIALGHTPNADGDWEEDDEDHPSGWGDGVICPATRYADACTYCESEDCPWQPFDTSALWKAVSA